MSQSHHFNYNNNNASSVTFDFTKNGNDVLTKKSSSSSQLINVQSETQESSNFELIHHDTVIQRYLDSSSQDIIFSQDSQAATKKYLLEETENTTSSQLYDSIVSSSQQVTIDDTIPPPLSQDSFMKNYYPASQEIVVEEHQNNYRHSSIPEEKPENESDDYKDEDEDDEYNNNRDERSNIGGFGVLSQGDHVIMSMGGELRNVFGSESKLTQELPLSQLTADGPSLSRCQSHTVLDENNAMTKDDEYTLKVTRSTESTSVDRERLRMELSYSNTCNTNTKSYSNSTTNNKTTTSCSNTISFCESASSSVVSDLQQQQQHHIMTSNLGSLLEAVHLKEQEQQQQQEKDKQQLQSAAIVDPTSKYTTRRAKLKAGTTESCLPPKIHKKPTILDFNNNSNTGIQDTVNTILKPGGASKKRQRGGVNGTAAASAVVSDTYVSVGLTEPYAKRVSPSTIDSIYTTVDSVPVIHKTPPRRTNRSNAKLTVTGISDFSPMVIQSPIPENSVHPPKKATTPTRKSKQPQQPKPRKNAKKKDADDTFLDDNDDDDSGENAADHLQIAQEAASLAARALKDQGLASRLLLSLILTREKPGGSNRIVLEQLKSTRTDANAATADNPFYMPVGFQWCEFPPLEELLKKNRKKYYELSMNPTLRQTVEQLSFNNQLVTLVRQVSLKYHWVFYHRKSDKTESQDSSTNSERHNWTDKALRDRIRFFYKTNLQNARGRLHTMLKNPSKRSNARNLNALYRLLQESNNSATTSSPNTPVAPSPPPSSSGIRGT